MVQITVQYFARSFQLSRTLHEHVRLAKDMLATIERHDHARGSCNWIGFFRWEFSMPIAARFPPPFISSEGGIPREA